MKGVTSIVTGCSLDARFLFPCIANARMVSERVILVLCDSLFNGDPEPLDFIGSARRTFNMIADVEVFPRMPGMDAKWHHNMARWLGIKKAKTDWLLLLDADEIVEAPKLSERLLTGPGPYSSLSFACYWYFRSPAYRAKTVERAGLFCRRDLWDEDKAFTPKERYWMEGAPWHGHGVFDHDGKPLLHHYSWVHTKNEMLRKVAGWGHAGDHDWAELVEEEFKREKFDPAKDTDFVHGYQYEKCEPYVTFEPGIMEQ